MQLGAARRMLVLLLLMGATVWAAEDGLVLTGSDVLCRPGEEAGLAVKVEERGWRHKDVEGARVSAVLVTDGVRRPLADAVTDGEGWAAIPVSFKEPGLYRVSVEAVKVDEESDERGSEEFLVACRSTERLMIVLDIDDTLTASDASVLSASAAVRDPDTVAVVRALAERYDLVYLTARVRWGSQRTRRWLRDKGFPRAPLFIRDLRKPGALRSGTYKKQVLTKLRQRFPNIVAGVGDEDSNVEAYADNGMIPILIEEEEDEAWNVERWSEIRELLLDDAVTFTRTLSCELKWGGKPWRARCEQRSGPWELTAPGLGPVRGSWAEVRSVLFEQLRKRGTGQ